MKKALEKITQLEQANRELLKKITDFKAEQGTLIDQKTKELEKKTSEKLTQIEQAVSKDKKGVEEKVSNLPQQA